MNSSYAQAVAATATSYLVLASQRSGSTLLVESLRATGCAGEPQEFFQYLPTTGMAPQPREWFAGVDDETILRLLDPLQPGTPDTATPVAWREHIRSSGRTPNGVWGGKLMWNQTPLLQEWASGLPDRSGDGLRAAIRDVIGSEPVFVHVYRPDVVSQAVSFWRAVQTQIWRGPPEPTRDSRAEYHAGAIAHIVKILQAQEDGWRTWFAEEGITPIDVAYPVLWRNLTAIVASVLEALGLDPRLAPAPVLERQADQRSDEWVDRYRQEAQRLGLPQ
ncbi:MAG TPA: Stf0 family sulfotransferase [Mycobacterium sp.]|nr:Stf0 family sulfotransferase [Mycobacterium sp.]